MKKYTFLLPFQTALEELPSFSEGILLGSDSPITRPDGPIHQKKKMALFPMTSTLSGSYSIPIPILISLYTIFYNGFGYSVHKHFLHKMFRKAEDPSMLSDASLGKVTKSLCGNRGSSTTL